MRLVYEINIDLPTTSDCELGDGRLTVEESQEIGKAISRFEKRVKLSEIKPKLIYAAKPNLVIRVVDSSGSAYILKVARSRDAATAHIREEMLIKQAESLLGGLIVVPTGVIHSVDPSSLVYKEVEGERIYWKELLTKEDGKRNVIGTKLGEVLAKWHTVVLGEHESSLIQGPDVGDLPFFLLKNAFDAVWDDSDERIGKSLKDEFKAATKTIYKWLLDAAVARKPVQPRPIHNDINANNFLFNQSGELFGLIDFGNACVDDVHAEFRFLCYRDWDGIAASAIDAYQRESRLVLESRCLLFQALLAGLSVVKYGETVEKSKRSDDVIEFLDFCKRHGVM